MSGCWISSRHRATRRRSPPESTSTTVSGGGQRSASMASSRRESSSHAPMASILSWTSAWRSSTLLPSRRRPWVRRSDRQARRIRRAAPWPRWRPPGRSRARSFRPRARVPARASHGVAGRPHDLAVGRLFGSRHDSEQGRLPGAVQTQDADLGAVEETQRDIAKYGLLAVGLGDLDHGKNHLLIF